MLPPSLLISELQKSEFKKLQLLFISTIIMKYNYEVIYIITDRRI